MHTISSFRAPPLLAPLVVMLALGCVDEPKASPLPGNLLAAAQSDNKGIGDPERLTDGLVPVEGDFWETGITARFGNPEGQITWDLGAKKPLAAALVQGDNNDAYILTVSDDGKTFRPLWQGQPEPGAGMRMRQATFKDAGRYVRLTAAGGDSLFSVGEVAVFSEVPAGWPNIKMARAEGAAADKMADASASWGISLGVFAAAVVVLVLLSRRSRPATPQKAADPASSPPDPPVPPTPPPGE